MTSNELQLRIEVIKRLLECYKKDLAEAQARHKSAVLGALLIPPCIIVACVVLYFSAIIFLDDAAMGFLVVPYLLLGGAAVIFFFAYKSHQIFSDAAKKNAAYESAAQSCRDILEVAQEKLRVAELELGAEVMGKPLREENKKLRLSFVLTEDRICKNCAFCTEVVLQKKDVLRNSVVSQTHDHFVCEMQNRSTITENGSCGEYRSGRAVKAILTVEKQIDFNLGRLKLERKRA